MNKLNHVAFIMDGNGRWGQKKNKGRNFGHLNGVKTVKKTVETAVRLKIPIITFYVFSTENWKRPKSEINFLFKCPQFGHLVLDIDTTRRQCRAHTCQKRHENKCCRIGS